MQIAFDGEIWFWKGPAPWFFITVPPQQAESLKAISSGVTYGWGMIPVNARIGKTQWTTSLFPKDGSYLVPIKANVRKSETLKAGDTVTVHLAVG